MERVFSDEEKIRRAIEISERRNQQNYKRDTVSINENNKKEYRLFKRMILQMIICLLIYCIFYLLNTTNYMFSEELLKSTSNILNYDINLEKIYEDFKNILLSSFNNNDNKNINSSIITNNIINTTNIITKTTETTNEIKNSAIVNKNTDKSAEKGTNKKEEKEEKTAMELDAEKVKKICKFNKPLSGTITSEFGEREVILDGMTSDHKGIDIAAESGTNIKAAMAGTVSVADENNEYGKFLKIVNNDVMTVYAHCKTLKVKAGDKIKIGQNIATVGSTGKSTGPHLHFEIRLSNRYINPRYVIEF